MSRANELEQQMLGLINEERTSQGLTPVELELRLNESSEDHSQWMLNEDQFSHTGVNGSSAGDRMRDAEFDFDGNWTWGENIAYQSERGAPGLNDDVENLHTALMNSPGHRANILNPDYEVVGLGIETGDFNGVEAVMVTQNFARTDAELQLDQTGDVSATPEAETPAPELGPDPGPVTPEPVAEAPDTDDETPTSDPEPEAETPDPETEAPEEPIAEAPEPETEDPQPEPVAETPDPAPEAPIAEVPEETPAPEPEDPQPEPVAETPDPDAEPETPEPVAEVPTEEPETPMPDPEPDQETPEPEPETPEVVNEDPGSDNTVSPFAQLQFFATGFLAVLLDEDFTFTFEGEEEGEAQTVSFDLDDFFDSLLEAPEGDDGMAPEEDDMVMAAQDAADDGDTAFQFTDHWDCLA